MYNYPFALLSVEVAWIYIFLENFFRPKIPFIRKGLLFLIPLMQLLALSATVDDPITGWRFNVIDGFGVIIQTTMGYLILKAVMQKNREAWIML